MALQNGANEASNTTRRTVVKTIGSGAFLAGAGTLSGRAKTIDRRTRIVTARGGWKDEPIETMKVPASWRAHEMAMREIHEQVVERIDDDRVVSIGRGASNEKKAGLTFSQPVITVLEDEAEEAASELPGSLSEAGIDVPNGVAISDIRIETTSSPPVPLYCDGTTTEDPYPGGIYINANNTVGGGTAGYRMYDGKGEYMLTANHVVSDSCDLGDTKTYAYNNDDIGYIIDGHKVHDWALTTADSTGVTDIENKIWYDGGKETTISGYKTKSGLEALLDVSGAINKQGLATGYETGTLVGLGECAQGPNLCIRMDCSGVKVNIDGAKGDSGGPIWESGSDGAEIVSQSNIAGNKTSRTNCDGKNIYTNTFGWPTFKIVNNNSYKVG